MAGQLQKDSREEWLGVAEWRELRASKQWACINLWERQQLKKALITQVCIGLWQKKAQIMRSLRKTKAGLEHWKVAERNTLFPCATSPVTTGQLLKDIKQSLASFCTPACAVHCTHLCGGKMKELKASQINSLHSWLTPPPKKKVLKTPGFLNLNVLK